MNQKPGLTASDWALHRVTSGEVGDLTRRRAQLLCICRFVDLAVLQFQISGDMPLLRSIAVQRALCAAILEECKFHRDLFEDDAA